MQKAIKRSTLLPLIGRIVEGTAQFWFVKKEVSWDYMLLQNIKIRTLEYDHIWVKVPKNAYIKRDNEIKFKAKVVRYANWEKCGFSDFIFL